MARKFWNDEDYTQGSSKTNYLRDYSLKNGLTKGLRKVEVDRLDELLGELDLTRAIEYFETLPDNFKKSFKVGYRQHVKREKSGFRGKQIEIDDLVSITLDGVLRRLAKVSPDELEKYRAEQEVESFRDLSLRDAVLYQALSEFEARLISVETDPENKGKSLIESVTISRY